MRQDNKLNKALKGALGGHTEPLHDGQWERLSAVLGEKKKKNRFLPWFILICLVGMSSLLVGFWLGNRSEKQIVLSQDRNSIAGNSHTGATNEGMSKNQSSKDGQQATSPGDSKKPDRSRIDDNNPSELSSSPVKRNAGIRRHVRANNTHRDIAGTQGIDGHRAPAASDTETKSDDDQNKPGLPKDDPKSTQGIEDGPDKHGPDITTNAVVDDTDSVKKLKKIDTTGQKKDHHMVGMRSRFAVGFATGFSVAHFAVTGIAHEEKMHRDARTIYDENNKNTRSQFVNLSFEWYPVKNLGLNISAGVQYRQLQQNLNFDYRLTSIPFRDMNGAISFYLPDSNGLTFNVREKNIYNFVNIPLRIGYTIPIGVKQELGVSAGLNMSFMTGAKGKSFVVDEVEEKPLSETYRKKFNTGYSASFFYSRNLYRHWWIGLEMQWQSTRMNYEEKYATIKSSLHVKSYNCALRYKF